MRFFKITVGRPGEEGRDIVVPSKTVVQASDAAAPLMKPGERILDVVETESEYQQADGMPPGTQAHPDQPV